MSAVSGAKGVVHITIGKTCQPVNELFLFFFDRFFCRSLFVVGSVGGEIARFTFFFFVEAEVFEQQKFAGFEVFRHFGSLIAHTVAGKKDFLTDQFFQYGDNVFERIIVGHAFGSPQMRHGDN